jgi:hypothetical protein
MTYHKSLEPGNILCKEDGERREVGQYSARWRAFVKVVMNILVIKRRVFSDRLNDYTI